MPNLPDRCAFPAGGACSKAFAAGAVELRVAIGTGANGTYAFLEVFLNHFNNQRFPSASSTSTWKGLALSAEEPKTALAVLIGLAVGRASDSKAAPRLAPFVIM